MICDPVEGKNKNRMADGKVGRWYHWGIERNPTKDLYNITRETVLEKNVRNS
jgi:hypothetical protein